MSKLPKARIVAAPVWQKERLARWLREWRIEQMMKEEEADPSFPALAGSAGEGQVPEAPRVGQIRLLRPCHAGAACRPVSMP